MRAFSAGLLAAAALLASPAVADETWKTDLGTIEWEKDVSGAAVFKVDHGQGKLARFYIEGLTADDTHRGAYSGYWISTAEDNLCAAELVGPDGTRSKTWGRIDLTFVKGGFPSDWTSKTGECMGEPYKVMNGIAPK